jgi:ribosomal protein S18 acetylase RimI-like enzyme
MDKNTVTRFSAPAAKANHAGMNIRPASSADAPAVWSIIEPMIRAGETYALDPNLSRAEALAYWMGAEKEVFVAEQAGAILGTYYMRPNQAGGGQHVCNCGYVTAPDATGKGVARSLCEHSMATARAHGYRAMQFNFVVSTNLRAISLWQKMGFKVVGTLPGAFRHTTYGYVDAFVMYQAL